MRDTVIPAATQQRSRKVSNRSCQTRSRRPNDLSERCSAAAHVPVEPLAKTEIELDCVLRHTATKGLAKPTHHTRVPNRQRHIHASRQMANIPSFLMRTDSEKHCTVTWPPHGVDARDGGRELKRQGESRLEAMRRKFRLDAQPFGRWRE